MQNSGIKWLLGLILLGVSLTCYAAPYKPVLNEVLYQTSAEQWVKTATAEVTVEINASLTASQLAELRASILEKLNKLAKSDWHITQFNSTANQSGLEQLQIFAQTRLAESALGNLRDAAKSISKPGETFTLASINFVPTLAENEAVRTQLRHLIYQRIQAELTQLNKTYPSQQYAVHRIEFTENSLPQPARGPQMMAMAMNKTAVAEAAPLTVANKIVLTARADLAAIAS